MVMTPEPLGRGVRRARRRRRHAGGADARPGRRSPRRWPASWPAATRLVFACGRYEGIDQRVLDHAATRAEVVEVSLGDYVLNGGEVAALAITEAVVRLLPGFMGNAESLVEESHEDGLLEYPVYTRPPSWRGLDVPAVLLSGTTPRSPRGGRRSRGGVRRERRPDLLHPSRPRGSGRSCRPRRGDAGEILTLQRACWVQEALANDDLARHPGPARVAGGRRGVAGRPGRPASSASRAGWSAPSAAGSRTPAPGTSAGSWSPPTCRAAAWAGCCSSTSRRWRPRGDVVRPVHRRPQRRQPADVPEGRLPAAHGPRGPAARRHPDQARISPVTLQPRACDDARSARGLRIVVARGRSRGALARSRGPLRGSPASAQTRRPSTGSGRPLWQTRSLAQSAGSLPQGSSDAAGLCSTSQQLHAHIRYRG